MLSIGLAFIVTVWVICMILKKYKPQPILFIAGMVLLVFVIVFNFGPLLSAKQSTGSKWFDIFELTKNILSERAGGLGLIIMAIAGFAKYMDYIGAGKSLYAVVATPIKWLGSPYLILAIAFLLGQIMVLFVPSHTGLALLLMTTMYPILVRSGISPLSSVAVVGMCHCMDYGPGSASVNFSSSVCGLDPVTYFVHYQLPVVIPLNLLIAVTIYFSQRWWDKKEGFDSQMVSDDLKKENEQGRPPLVYAILPMIPLVLLLGFSPLVHSAIKMNVVTAMLMSIFVAMVFEAFRWKNIRKVLDSFLVFFEGMGKVFISVVSLLVGGQLFAEGLIKLGTIDLLISGAQSLGVGIHMMIIIASIILAVASFLMGSGDAAMFAFGALVPKMVSYLGNSAVTLMIPMQLMVGLGRTVSPIAPPIAGIAGIAGVTPMQIIKRTAIPMLVGAIGNVVINFILL